MLYFRMEGLQIEIEKLLDIITVLLVKLEEAGNNVVSEIKYILDKSRNEVQLIQNSLTLKYKQEECHYEEDDTFDYNPDVSESSDIVKEEEVKTDMTVENKNSGDSSSENPFLNTVKIDFMKKSGKDEDDSEGNEGLWSSCESKFYHLRKCTLCLFYVDQSSEWKVQLKEHLEVKHPGIQPKRFSNMILECKNCRHKSHHTAEAVQHFREICSEEVNKICVKCDKKVPVKSFDEHKCDFVTVRKCMECEALLTSNSDMKDHFHQVHSFKLELLALQNLEMSTSFSHYQCLHCKYASTNSSNLYRHVNSIHKPTTETCYLCGHISKNKISLIAHINKKHRAPEGQTKCEQCLNCFPNENFEGHLCERQKIICNICGKTYVTEKSLKEHIKVEHEKVVITKSFFCHKCDFSCTTKGGLSAHMISHEEKNPCPECGERVRDLKSHKLTVHTPDDLKKHQCQDCGKGFNELKKLEIHRMNIHLKLRPHKCRYGCNVSYNDTSNRNAHEKKTHGKLFTTVKEEKLKARMQ